MMMMHDEREQIGLAKAVGHSIGAIAKAIGGPKFDGPARTVPQQTAERESYSTWPRAKFTAGLHKRERARAPIPKSSPPIPLRGLCRIGSGQIRRLAPAIMLVYEWLAVQRLTPELGARKP